LQQALAACATLGEIVAVSSFHDTTPVGGPPQQSRFLNAAAILRTNDSPAELLANLQTLEHSLGRVRSEHWGPRAIDLDMLLVDQLELNSPALILPHPRMAYRRFVLDPAVEIASDWIFPINGWTLKQLAENTRQLPRTLALCGLQAEEVAANLRRLPVATEWTITATWQSDARLIVVLPTAAEELQALDRRRRLATSPPVLWLANAARDSWQWEIVAALAALGTGIEPT
jgi:2-amino-4-hydroxy-6-hydroxymethyldihydropteridine diphosphokinase